MLLGRAQRLLSYVVNRGVNGLDAYQSLGVCFNQCASGSTTVSLDYISSHDGSSNTLLLSESVMTEDGAARSGTGDTTSLDSPYMRLRAFTGNTASTKYYYDRPSSRWTASAWTNGSSDVNLAELNLGFEWGYFSGDDASISEKISSRHNGSYNVAFCDGHAAAISDSVDLAVFRQLMIPNSNGAIALNKQTSNPLSSISPTLSLSVLDESAF